MPAGRLIQGLWTEVAPSLAAKRRRGRDVRNYDNLIYGPGFKERGWLI